MSLSSQSEVNYFTRIFEEKEKQKLFQDLADQKGEIIAKKPDPQADVFLLKALSYRNNVLLATVSVAELQEKNGTLLFQFFLGGDKYYFQGKFTRVEDQVQIGLPEDAYKLQRRLDFRIKVPATYRLRFLGMKYNGKDADFTMPISDLSGGGCRFEWSPGHPSLNSGDQLSGILQTPDRGPLQVEAVVKHMMPHPTRKNGRSYGIQFVNLREAAKNKIVALVMDLYREFFSSLKN